MKNLLSLRPASAALGQERRDGYVQALSRRVKPFTRTVGRLIDRREIYRRSSVARKMVRSPISRAAQAAGAAQCAVNPAELTAPPERGKPKSGHFTCDLV
jgi:hypothetical protein